jgi:hypothetical protein
MIFFEILALAWILSICANTGIHAAMNRAVGKNPNGGELVKILVTGPLGLAFSLTELWLERQGSLETIATNFKRKP